MTNVNPDNQESQPENQATEGAHAAPAAGGAAASSFPFRGLAMVLITVAVLLGLWGVYALTQGDGSQNAASQQTTESQEASPEAGSDAGTDTSQEPSPAPAPSESAKPAESAQPSPAEGREGANAPAGQDRGADRADAPAAGGAAAPGAPAAPAAPRAEVVNVYNNSTVQGLASNVSESLRDRGYDVDVDTGNITEDEMILPETTVFYDPAVDGAETRARELADLVGGVAQKNVDNLPKEATEGGALTLVLAGEVNL
ncbi:LytR C-terminal domain-containing protein [Corynebacterium lubricantis]|uniref:LytR C-terminal domain-containing protein n=1 Tax=Corynebacterium lubricantis TaxID=541095 RepID=UPI000367BEBA|nr:LytR C-terminal domain-containing protein [Corynebacterium lubricantis]